MDFPRLHEPTVSARAETTVLAVKHETIKSADDPVVSVIQQLRDPSINIKRKTHQLPTSKEYLVKEYVHMFQGIETLYNGSYI